MAVDFDTQRIICKFGGWLVLTGLLCLVAGEGIGPLVAGVLTTLVLAGLANRLSWGSKKR